jgi:hypothetical protein
MGVEIQTYARSFVPSPSGDVIAFVEGRRFPPPEDPDANELWAVFFDAETMAIVQEVTIDNPHTFQGHPLWLSDEEFRFGGSSVFRDGTVITDLPHPPCGDAATPSGPVNADGLRLVVDYDGDDFEISTVADPPGWPDRCAPVEDM